MKHDCNKLFLISFLISVIPALFYTAPAFEDGLGTMATAAYLTGHDWSAFLAEDGYYYKYGQALWYVLPFICIHNAVIRYKVMLMINSVITSFIPVIAYYLGLKYEIVDESDAFGIAMLAGIFPSLLLYNKYTWAETNLFIIPWVILLLLARLHTGVSNQKLKRIYSALLAFVSVYAFMSHQRGLVIVIATTITVIWIVYNNREQLSVGIYMGTLAAGLFIDHFIVKWQKATVYAGAVLQHNTLADFLKPDIYRKLFTLQGMGTILKLLLGWLYNCAASTYGISLLGIGIVFVGTVRCLKKKRLDNVEDVFTVQIFLCFAGALMLGLLFFFQSMYDYFNGTLVERCDHLLFGRYLESCLPMLLYIGLIRMKREWYRLSVTIQFGLFVFVSVCLFPLMQRVNCYVHSLMSMNLFMDTGAVRKTLDVIPNYAIALFLFGAMSIMVCVFFQLIYQRNRYVAYALIGILFLCIYIWNCVTVIGRVDDAGETVYAQYYLMH